jgi:plasmid stabilization system protein ParE
MPVISRAQAVVRVGNGRGFVVEHGRKHDRRRLIITAAHCLPLDNAGNLKRPTPDAQAFTDEKTYPNLLGRLGAEPTVCAECLFADAIADIAVLGGPDNQDYPAVEAEAYWELVASATPFEIADAPKMGRKREQLPYGNQSIEIDTEGRGSAYVLSLDGEWLR